MFFFTEYPMYKSGINDQVTFGDISFLVSELEHAAWNTENGIQ